VRPLLVACIAGVSGWLLCMYGPRGLWIALASASMTFSLVAIGLWLVCRRDLKDTVGLAFGTIRSALPGLNRASIDNA